MIIGLTGSMGSGKGELVKLLEEKGFNYVTLSAMVREEARNRGVVEEREKLMEVGNSMRSEHGAGVLGKRALEKVMGSDCDLWVIDGIRNPAEILELRKGEDVFVVGIKTDKDLLLERILSRNRDSDPVEKDDILRKIERELGKDEPEDGQQVAKCMDLVDRIIENETTLEEFQGQFIDYLNMINRPSKDDYYLNLARSVCKRSTCTKVEIGAVIIRDDQVVSTGYCGAPRGTKSSQDHGFCLRKKLGIPSGHRYEMCRSVHAEQNAIINAARAGVSLLDGDMYIYGKIQGDGEEIVLDAFPCFICKKMLINCGLKRVICSLKEGGYKVFYVSDWVEQWKENDIIDDKYQYGEKTK